jgi:hypothetical protein
LVVSRYRGGRQTPDKSRRFAYLLLLFTELSPLGIDGAVFLRSFVRRLHLPASLCSTGITPFLGSYGGSVISRAQFFVPLVGLERCSFPVRDTCSYRSNFRPFCLQAPFCIPISPGIGREISGLLDGTVSVLGFATERQARQCILAESSSSLFCLRSGRSLPAALHSASRRRSCLQLRADQCSVRWGLPPHRGVHSQAHKGARYSPITQ